MAKKAFICIKNTGFSTTFYKKPTNFSQISVVVQFLALS